MDRDGKERLLRFIGYGRLDAPIWFLGMEEGGGGEERLSIQSKFNQIEDLRDAHRKLDIREWHEGRRKLQPQWNKMSEFMLRVEGHSGPTREERRAYQAEHLGRSHGNSLLLELLPLPKPNVKSWDYSLSFPEYVDVAAYRNAIVPQRIALISILVAKHKPRIIVAYGKEYWGYYRQIMSAVEFSERSGFSVGSMGETTMILTHFLSRKEMNGRHEILANIALEFLGGPLADNNLR